MITPKLTDRYLVWCPDLGESEDERVPIDAKSVIDAAEKIASKIDRGDPCEQDHGYTLLVRRIDSPNISTVDVAKRVTTSWVSGIRR